MKPTQVIQKLNIQFVEPQENVSQFALRVETCLSQLLTEVSLSNTKVKELPGRAVAMGDLALHHFLGLHPRIYSQESMYFSVLFRNNMNQII